MKNELTYEEKIIIADNYLLEKVGLGWNDLADINSLHDYNTKEEIIEACDERLQDDLDFEIFDE